MEEKKERETQAAAILMFVCVRVRLLSSRGRSGEPQPASVAASCGRLDLIGGVGAPPPSPPPTLLIGAANPACSIRTIIVLLVSCLVLLFVFVFFPHYAHLFPLFLS